MLDLYHYLGSPRLSSLVKEDYRTSGEVPHSKIGAQTGRLILERLPLFLRDHPQSRTKVTLNWLNEGNNFIVKVFGKLLVTKSLQYGNTRDSKSLEAYWLLPKKHLKRHKPDMKKSHQDNQAIRNKFHC